MPSTAWTTPSSVRNSTTRSLIERIGSGTDSPLLRVESVAKPVADEVHAEHDQDDRQTRKDRQPPLLGVRLRVRDEDAERRGRVLDPEPEERERGLGDDRRADGERSVDDDRAEGVREDVAEHDPHVAGAARLRRLDVLLLAEREEDAAHDACDARPEEGGEDERRPPLAPLAEERGRRQQDRD